MTRKEVSRRSPSPSKPTPRPTIPGIITMPARPSESGKSSQKLPLHGSSIKKFIRIEASGVYGLDLIADMVKGKCEYIGIEVFTIKDDMIAYKNTLVFKAWLKESQLNDLVEYLSEFDGLNVKVMVNDEAVFQTPKKEKRE